MAIKNSKKGNEFRVDGDVAYIKLKNMSGDVVGEAIIDVDRLETVLEKTWHLNATGYATCKNSMGSWSMHRVLYGDSKYVDHINLNKLDNRLVNLRDCSQSQNIANSTARKSSKTGVKGVFPRKGKFVSQITKDRKVYCLGTYKTIEEAKDAYMRKAIELFGEFARA